MARVTAAADLDVHVLSRERLFVDHGRLAVQVQELLQVSVLVPRLHFPHTTFLGGVVCGSQAPFAP
jgi:hypothetical protein